LAERNRLSSSSKGARECLREGRVRGGALTQRAGRRILRHPPALPHSPIVQPATVIGPDLRGRTDSLQQVAI
jgi:hypothetical protein